MIASLVVPSAAMAGTEHPAVVSDQAAEGLPRLVPTERWPRPRVDALARVGDMIYVGGAFERLVEASGEVHDIAYLAQIDAVTGDVTPFTAFPVQVNRPVQDLVVQRGRLYVGGEFTTVNGEPRRALAKVHATTGQLVKRFNAKLTEGVVRDVGFARGRLVAAGSFPGYLQSFSKKNGRRLPYLSPRVTGKVHRAASPTMVHRFAVSPTNKRLVVVGNFKRVDRKLRKRAFMVALGGRRTELTDWYYDPLRKACSGRDPYRLVGLSDVDFSPDGSYFVFGSTGGPVPLTEPSSVGTAICDAVARFETSILAPTAPTWINYTGGDTIWSVINTGAAVYLQGHFRWLDNPEGRNYEGPGAIPRRGIGAVDPATGEVLPWDPDKPARRGGRAFLADSGGLWVGSDCEGEDPETETIEDTCANPIYGLSFLPLPSEPETPTDPPPTP